MAEILYGLSYKICSAILPKCFAFGLFILVFGISEIRLYCHKDHSDHKQKARLGSQLLPTHANLGPIYAIAILDI